MPGRNTRNAADVERRAGGCAQILAGHANAPDGATRRSPIGGGALLHLCWRVSAGRRSRGSDTPVSLNADRKRSGKLAASSEFDLELLNIVRLGQRRLLYYQGPATTGCTAARASRPEGCRGRSTRAPAAWLATSPRPRPIRPRASSAKSRDAVSRTSNASSSSIGSDFAGQMVLATNSTSPPPRRTSANSPSWFPLLVNATATADDRCRDHSKTYLFSGIGP